MRLGLVRFGRALLARWKLRRCAAVGDGVRVIGRVCVRGSGEVRLGARVTLDGGWAPIELHAGAGARLVLGEDVVVGAGTSIEALESVTIGARVRVGQLCKIMDNPFHFARGDRSTRPRSTPIVIEADAILGPRAILLPGARVGRGATVGAGSVLTRSVPHGAAAAGVPAVVRKR